MKVLRTHDLSPKEVQEVVRPVGRPRGTKALKHEPKPRKTMWRGKPIELKVEPRKDRVCKCGRCQRCQDNARWERIFKEKFEDPTYYTRPSSRATNMGSSLGGNVTHLKYFPTQAGVPKD